MSSGIQATKPPPPTKPHCEHPRPTTALLLFPSSTGDKSTSTRVPLLAAHPFPASTTPPSPPFLFSSLPPPGHLISPRFSRAASLGLGRGEEQHRISTGGRWVLPPPRRRPMDGPNPTTTSGVGFCGSAGGHERTNGTSELPRTVRRCSSSSSVRRSVAPPCPALSCLALLCLACLV